MQHKMHVNWITPLENLLPLICLSRAGWHCTEAQGVLSPAYRQVEEQGGGQGCAAMPRQGPTVPPSLSLSTLCTAARAGHPTLILTLFCYPTTTHPTALHPSSVTPSSSTCVHAYTSVFFSFQEWGIDSLPFSLLPFFPMSFLEMAEENSDQPIYVTLSQINKWENGTFEACLDSVIKMILVWQL